MSAFYCDKKTLVIMHLPSVAIANTVSYTCVHVCTRVSYRDRETTYYGSLQGAVGIIALTYLNKRGSAGLRSHVLAKEIKELAVLADEVMNDGVVYQVVLGLRPSYQGEWGGVSDRKFSCLDCIKNILLEGGNLLSCLWSRTSSGTLLKPPTRTYQGLN